MKTRIIAVPQPPSGVRYDTLASLPHVLTGWSGWYVLALAWNVAVHLCTAAAAGGAAWAVAAAVRGVAPEYLWWPTILVLAATILRSVSLWQEAYTSHDLSFRVMARIRVWVFNALARVAPGGLGNRRRGDITSTTMNDAEALEVFLAHSSLYRFGRFLATPLILIGLAWIDPRIALATVPFLAVLLIVPPLTRRAALRDGAAARQALAAMAAEVQENTGAVREIVAFELQDARRQRLARIQDELSAAQTRTVTRTGVESAITGVAAAALSLTAAAVGALDVQAGHLKLVWLPVAIAVAAISPSAILQWISTSRHTGNTAAAARRIEAILEADPALEQSPQEPARDTGDAALEASGVCFTWPGATQPAVHAVNLRIAAGEHVAITGRSGSGKSTLAQLLARWQDPDAGTIHLDGEDLRSLPVAALREQIRLIPQDPHLFAETVRENLLLAAGEGTDLDDTALWTALEQAGAAQAVRRLPQRLDTVLADHGASLSGGERQRIALARTFLHAGQVLLLDESVSQLDTGAAASVQQALAAQARTTVVIAHRLVTLLQAQRIIVMAEGRIVGDGTHTELLKTCSSYRSLVEPQLMP